MWKLAGLALAVNMLAVPAMASTFSLQQTSPSAINYVFGADFGAFSATDNSQVDGSATGSLSAVPSFGCSVADFAGFSAGSIALISRGTCTFQIKAQNALIAGAIGLILYNRTGGLIAGTVGTFKGPMPVLNVTLALGTSLLQQTRQGPVVISMVSDHSPAPVPLPATLPLLAAGLAGLGLAGRRRKKQAQRAIA